MENFNLSRGRIKSTVDKHRLATPNKKKKRRETKKKEKWRRKEEDNGRTDGGKKRWKEDTDEMEKNQVKDTYEFSGLRRQHIPVLY